MAGSSPQGNAVAGKDKGNYLTEGFEFLRFRFGAHLDKRYRYGPRVEIPKAGAANLRHKVKQLTQRDSISVSLGELLPPLYRRRPGVGALDWYIGLRLSCWLPKKRPKATPSKPRGSKQPSRRQATRRVSR